MSAQSEAFKQMVGDRFGGNQQMYQDAIPTEPEPATTEEAARDSSGGVLSGVLDSIGNAVGSIVQSIDDYYTNNARQQFAALHDENGQVTPESIAETTDPQTYAYSQGITGDYENPEENAVYQAASDPGYDLQQQDPNTFGYNFRREVNEWGDNAAQDAWKLGTDIVDGLTASSWQDLQGGDNTAADDAWKLYTDIAAPAGKIAVTPFLPPQMRAIAGAVYAPKMLADIREMYNQGAEGNPEAGEEGGALAGVGNVAYGMLAQPFIGLAHDLTNIDQLAADIQQNPSQLWDRVFMPATMVEAGAKGGRKAYDIGKDLKNIDKTIGDIFDDATPRAMDSISEEGGYTPVQDSVPADRVSSIDTGHPELDGIMAEAASTYGVPLDLLHKVAEQESEHGRTSPNIMQVLDSTGKAMGFDDMSDPRQSVFAGAKYLREMLDNNKGDVESALRDYNGGGDPNYVEHVLSHTDYDGIAGEADTGGAYEAGASAWMGEGMPNGANGCVDAVVRIGSYYDSFLKDEADRGIAYVPTLVEDAKKAGREVIPFDESALEKGDIIVYGDNDHVVTYDGNGGYVGNSSSLGKVVHGGDYTQMGGLKPTKIIKTSDRSGGSLRDFADEGDMFADDSERGGSKTGDGLKDLDGNDIYPREDTEPLTEEPPKAPEESPAIEETPEQAAAREAKYKERYSDIDEEIERLEAERQRDIDEEVERMKRNPGGKGVDQGHFEGLEGENVRWTQSNNPDWYSEAYAKLGRPPRKSEYAEIAEANLSKFEEFGRRDEDIQWFKNLRDELKKDPDRDIGELMQEGGGLVSFDKAGKESRPQAAKMGNGFRTESGRPLEKASSDEYVVKTNGDKNFGVITPEISKAIYDGTGEILPPGNIRLKVGDEIKGLNHAAKHAIEIAKAGYSSVTDMISDIAQNFDLILKQEPKKEGYRPTYSLVKLGDKNGVAPFYMDIEPDGRGTYYAVITSIPKKGKKLAKQINKEHLIYSRPGVDAASLSNTKSGFSPESENVGAPQNRHPASDRLNASSTSNIPQVGANGAVSPKNNLVQNDTAPTRTNRAGMGTLERGEAVPDVNGNMPKAVMPKAKSNGTYGGEVTRKGIFDRARELFGTIRTGRVPRDTNGVYDRGSDVARVGSWANWDTMWHEIGHKVDQYLGLSDKAGMKYLGEFTRALSEKYGGDIPYRTDQFAPEGIAEFMKTYMTKGEDAARQKFPKYFEDFKAAVAENKDLAARVTEMRDAMQKYNNLPAGARHLADIQKAEAPKLSDRVKAALSEFMPKWVDAKWGIRVAEKTYEALTGHKLAADESPYQYARLARDRATDAANGFLGGRAKEAAKVIEAINKLYDGVCDRVATLPMAIEKLDHLEKTNKAWLKSQGLDNYRDALAVYLTDNAFLDAYNLKEVRPFEEAQKALEGAQANLKKAEDHLRSVRGEAPVAHAKEVYEQAKQDVEEAKAAVEKARNTHYRMPHSHKDYKQYVDGAPKELQEAAQVIYDINHNLLNIMEHEGILSKELRDRLEKDHPHYASLAREFEDNAGNADFIKDPAQKYINMSNQIKKLTDVGSVRDVKDPLESMIGHTTAMLMTVEQNKVGQKFVKLGEPYGTGSIVEKVSGTPSTKDSTFYVWIKGQKEVYQTTPELYQALNLTTPKGGNVLEKYLGELPARWFRAGAVTLNTSFLATNIFRDQLTAYLNSNYGYKPFYDIAKGVYHMLNRDELFQEFKTSGVLMSTLVNANKDFVGSLLKDAQRTAPEKVFHALNPLANLERLSNFVEEVTRLGLYSRARKHGATQIEATMEARRSTLDFGRMGSEGQKVNRISPFFNAAIQDPVTFMETFKEHPARTAKRCGTIVMGSLAVYALIQSSDQTAKEYDEMMSYEKNMFWNVPVPKSVCKTGWLRFPKPFGPGFLFASLPERLADLAKGRDNAAKNTKEWAKDFLGSLLPGALPPLLQAVLEWQTGYSFFQGRNITPQREKDLPAHMQYGPQTSELAKYIAGTPLAKWLSEDGALQVDMSPRKIDNLGQNLFAGSYKMATKAMDTALGRPGRNNNPLSALTVDPYRSPQSIQDFYEALGKANRDYSGAKHMGQKPSGIVEANRKMLAKANKVMSELNKQEQAAVAAGDDAKVDIINRKQLKLAQSALAQLK